MATSTKSVKPWKLSEEETFASFTSWQQNMSYCLNLDKNCQPFLLPTSTWLKVSPANPFRGLNDDAGENGLTKEQKLVNLTFMLGYISQFTPHYLSNDIIQNSTSMTDIWNLVRQYYGFQQSEVQFMKLLNITWQGPEHERPERLYRCILAHLQDNLLPAGSRLKHNGEIPTENEVLSPTVKRLAVLRWMELLHPKLPAPVARTFAYDLQRMTLKDIQPQVSDGLDSFLQELNREDTPVEVSKICNSYPKMQCSRSQWKP